VGVADGLQFGRQLQVHRKRRQLTQTQLSGLSTLSVRAIRNLEQGQVAAPRLDTVHLLADALRLTAQERVEFKLAAGCDVDLEMVEAGLTALPVEALPLCGREGDLVRLVQQVLGGRCRVTAVSGFRGVGKTRLAAAVAYAVQADTDVSVLWVPLSPDAADRLNDGETCHDAEEPRAVRLFARNGDVTDRVVRMVGDRKCLLVLDGNDGGQISRLRMRQLLHECRNLRILETSRGSRSPGEEFEFPLQPLSPGPAVPVGSTDLDLGPAMVLFLQCIAEVQSRHGPDEAALPVLAEVCRLLDGIPGMLKSAASWLRIVSCAQLLDLARVEPQVLMTRPGDIADVAAVLTEDIAALGRSQRELLGQLARWDEPWSVNDVASSFTMAPALAGDAIYTFLRAGFIVQDSGSERVARFRVLNVLRSLLRERSLPAVNLTCERASR
jgi:transcriptional regulator with XRE-family HTH domain